MKYQGELSAMAGASLTSVDAAQVDHPRPQARRSNLFACGILLLLPISFCVILGIGGTAFIAYYAREPEFLDLEYSIPFSVNRGDEFDLVISLTNRGESDLFIGDIDLDQSFAGSILDGAVAVSTEPPMERDFSIPGIKSFEFNRPLAAGETQDVVFHLKAVTEGEVGGPVAVYVGDIAKSIDYIGTTILADEP